MIQGHIRAQRRQRQIEGKMRYKYRGLPCNVRLHHEMFYVGGMDGNGGGILEWCVDYEDAVHRLRIMRGFPQFKNLRIGSNMEDDENYAKKQYDEMVNINPTDIPRNKYRQGIFACLQVMRNLKAWRPIHASIEMTEARRERDKLMEMKKIDDIKVWKSMMRRLRSMYYSDTNPSKETPEQAAERRMKRKMQ